MTKKGSKKTKFVCMVEEDDRIAANETLARTVSILRSRRLQYTFEKERRPDGSFRIVIESTGKPVGSKVPVESVEEPTDEAGTTPEVTDAATG